MYSRSLLFVVVSLLLLVVSVDARADEIPLPLARTLFDESVVLMEAERFEEAIPKLVEAQRLEPGTGIQFNLAVCYAKTNRLGSAYRNFAEVERAAQATGKKQREDAAHSHLVELRPITPSLLIRVDDPRDEPSVTLDGQAIARDEWSFVPLDPGAHRLIATRTGAEAAITIDFDAPPRGAQHEIVIPRKRVVAPIAALTQRPLEPNAPATTPSRRSSRTAGYILGAIGIVGLGTAIGTGAMILDEKSTADDHCRIGPCDQLGRDAVARMDTLMPINVIGWVVGLVGLGSASYLFFKGSSPQ